MGLFRRNNLGDALGILFGGLLGGLLFFFPILSQSMAKSVGLLEAFRQVFLVDSNQELLIGKGVDQLGSFWMVHQVGRMLTEGRSSVLESVYYPFGFDLGINTGFAWVDAALGVPLARWLGVPGFYNLHVYLVIALSISACMFLFRLIGIPLILAIPMAWLCFCTPFTIAELNLGRPTQISIWPLVGLLCIFVFQQTRNWQPVLGICAGVFMALSCLTFWFTGVGLGLGLVGLYLGWMWGKGRGFFRGIAFGALGILASLGLVLPVTWRMSGPLIQGRARQHYSGLLTPPEHIYDIFGLSLNSVLPLNTWENAVYILRCSCQHIPVFFLTLFCCFLSYGRTLKRPWILLWVFCLGLSVASGVSVFGVHVPTGLAISEWLFPPMLRGQFEGRNLTWSGT